MGLGLQPIYHDIICSQAVTQEFGEFPYFFAGKIGGSGIMVYPSAHSQHMNVLKHLVYLRSGGGNHSMWVWGLNQCTMTSFVAEL